MRKVSPFRRVSLNKIGIAMSSSLRTTAMKMMVSERLGWLSKTHEQRDDAYR